MGARSALAHVIVVGMLATNPAWADGVPVSEASKAQLKAAEKKNAAANKLFKVGNFQKAIELFLESHDIVADPNVSLMVARSYREMGELLPTRAEFLGALKEAEAAAQHDSKYQQTVSTIQKELQELELNKSV